MAKRAEIARQGLIILDAKGVADRYGTTERVAGAGGRVLHQYGSRILIGDVTPTAVRQAAAARGVRSLHASAVREAPRKLTDVEMMGLDAWNLRQSPRFAAAKDNRPHDGVRWDDAGPAAPIAPDGPGMTHVSDGGPERALAFGAAEETSTYLIGSVAVGIVIVEGPSPDLQFSDEERTKVVAEVQEGLTWLGRQEPKAGVTFSYDIHTVRIDVAPNPALTGYEPLESLWRDPGMAKLGFAPNMGGVEDYVRSIRHTLGTRWGYVGLFTKFPTEHFAYASRPRLVMQYSNDGWGPDNIDRVFTHETGHIFGCPDEYAASGCTCDATFGYLRERNGNCERCATPFVPCLMAANTWAMCSFTPVHVGWRDSDGDGALDPVDPVSHPNPLIDLRRICTLVPFLCQIIGVGRSPGAAGVAGIAAAAPGAAFDPGGPAMVPIDLLRQVLTVEEMARVEFGDPVGRTALPRGARAQAADRGPADRARTCSRLRRTAMDADGIERLLTTSRTRSVSSSGLTGPVTVLSEAARDGGGATYQVSASRLVAIDDDDPNLAGVSIPVPVNAAVEVDGDGSLVGLTVPDDDEETDREARAFARNLVANGSVRGLAAAGPARRGPPTHATHEVTTDDQGHRVIRRTGYSIAPKSAR